MGVVALTLITSLFIGGGAWLVVGSRLKLDADEDHNDLLNFIAYFIGTLPLSFVLIFFGIGG